MTVVSFAVKNKTKQELIDSSEATTFVVNSGS